MLLEGRRLHMVGRCEETSAVLRSGEPVETKLRRIAEKARREPGFKFTSLYHLMNEELLRGCFKRLRKNATAGIDKMTKDMYAEHLESHLTELTDGLQRMAYIPQPVRRRYIPKPGSTKQRPLGIPCFEDKLVQAGLVRILESVYEQDFMEDSYGFRPLRSCHNALRALSETVEHKPISYIVEADIKGFFDRVSQEWLMKFLAHRIEDKRVQRMVKRFLRAGVAEDGSVTVSDEGTPQGGVISPLLANIYLHYVLDLWFERIYRKRCTGYARLIRYADDFVVCFQYKAEAERFHEELGRRLGRFGLEVEPMKTKVMEFGRFAVQNAKRRGERAETFEFLGFTHYCGTKRDGKGFRMKRVTARKKFIAKLKDFKEWLKKARILKTRELWETAQAKLRGHYNYYGVTDNLRGIARFGDEVEKLLFKWLNRRGKKNCLNGEKFEEMLKRFPLPKPRIRVSMFGSSVN
ncbi:MAG: group II intron reverse transcriptase/maturase [Deltaproteobacteria bacterium]|nr:group II intron reverse transcriptase/maturase [Deltaproteobacteria bacterium]